MSPLPLNKGQYIQFVKYEYDNADEEYIEDTYHGEIYEVEPVGDSFKYQVFVKEKMGKKMTVKHSEIKKIIPESRFRNGFTPTDDYYRYRAMYLHQLPVPGLTSFLPSMSDMTSLQLDGKKSRRKSKRGKKKSKSKSKKSKKINYSKWTSCETCKTCSKCKAKFAKMGQTMMNDFPKIGWVWKRSRKNKA